MNALKRYFLVTAGLVSVAVGGIGIVLPVLPTTPFIILAALCFGVSSPDLYRKLSKSRYFGEYISNYKEKTGVSRKNKTVALIFLWLMLGISAYFLADNLIVQIVLLAVGICVTAHILLLRGKKD